MVSKKVLAVLGATGSQGGAIVDHFLRSAELREKFTVRAITRDITKAGAKALEAQGAELVAADMYDQASLEAAFEGVNIIYTVTNFFDTSDVEDEVRAGKNVIHAIQKIDSPVLEQILWSTLPDIRTMNIPYFNVLHFNGKADVRKYLKETTLWKKTIAIWIGFYMQNFTKYPLVFGPIKQSDGSFILKYPIKPDTDIQLIAIENLGPLIEVLTKNPSEYLQKTISLFGEDITPEDMLATWAKAVGVKAKFQEVSLEQFADRLIKEHDFKDYLAIDIGENLVAFRDNPTFWKDPTTIFGSDLIKANGGKLTTWETFVSTEDFSIYTN